jgi:hypothetical protein
MVVVVVVVLTTTVVVGLEEEVKDKAEYLIFLRGLKRLPCHSSSAQAGRHGASGGALKW